MGCLFALLGGALPASRAAHSLDRQTGPRRCGVQHLSPPVLGIIFLPFATLIYVIVYTPSVGLAGFDWFWVILAVLLDIGHWTPATPNATRSPGYGERWETLAGISPGQGGGMD